MMRLMLWSGPSGMVHASSHTFAVMEDISTSRLWWARDPSTHATLVVQPICRRWQLASLDVHEDDLG